MIPAVRLRPVRRSTPLGMGRTTQGTEPPGPHGSGPQGAQELRRDPVRRHAIRSHRQRNGTVDLRTVDVPQPPAHVVQFRDEESILIPRRAWRRLQRRIRAMPEPAQAWITLAGIFLGVALAQPALVWKAVFLAAAGLCAIAHAAVNRSRRNLRQDIADEMRLHEPTPVPRGD
jgi:hypothetical protein